MAGRLALALRAPERKRALPESLLPCARITSIRFKGTFSVATFMATPLAAFTVK